jgi:hypothetical protein
VHDALWIICGKSVEKRWKTHGFPVDNVSPPLGPPPFSLISYPITKGITVVGRKKNRFGEKEESENQRQKKTPR